VFLRLLVALGLVFLCTVQTLAGHKIDKIVADLKDEWLVFDNSYNHYVSYVPSYHKNTKLVHFWLKPQSYQSYQLVLHFNQDTYLYINHQIQKRYSKGWHTLSLDSLAKKQIQESLFISLYGDTDESVIGTLLATKEKTTARQNANTFKKNIQNLRQKAAYFLLILILAYTLLRQYDSKLLVEYLQVSKFLHIQRRLDNPLFIRILQNSNVLFLITYSLLIGTFFFLLGLMETKESVFSLSAYGISIEENNWLSWFVWVSLTLLWIIAKYFVLWIAGSLLGLSKLLNIHFYEYIRISHFFYLPLTLGLILLYLHTPHSVSYWYSFFKITLLFVFSLRFLILWRNTNSIGEFRKLDFFSYLCVSEFIPLTIYVKMLFFT
jgi:hypothetical protein